MLEINLEGNFLHFNVSYYDVCYREDNDNNSPAKSQWWINQNLKAKKIQQSTHWCPLHSFQENLEGTKLLSEVHN